MHERKHEMGPGAPTEIIQIVKDLYLPNEAKFAVTVTPHTKPKAKTGEREGSGEPLAQFWLGGHIHRRVQARLTEAPFTPTYWDTTFMEKYPIASASITTLAEGISDLLQPPQNTGEIWERSVVEEIPFVIHGSQRKKAEAVTKGYMQGDVSDEQFIGQLVTTHGDALQTASHGDVSSMTPYRINFSQRSVDVDNGKMDLLAIYIKKSEVDHDKYVESVLISEAIKHIGHKYLLDRSEAHQKPLKITAVVAGISYERFWTIDDIFHIVLQKATAGDMLFKFGEIKTRIVENKYEYMARMHKNGQPIPQEYRDETAPLHSASEIQDERTQNLSKNTEHHALKSRLEKDSHFLLRAFVWGIYKADAGTFNSATVGSFVRKMRFIGFEVTTPIIPYDIKKPRFFDMMQTPRNTAVTKVVYRTKNLISQLEDIYESMQIMDAIREQGHTIQQKKETL